MRRRRFTYTCTYHCREPEIPALDIQTPCLHRQGYLGRQALPTGGVLIACEQDERPLALAREMWQKAGVADKVCMRHVAPA